MDDENEVEKAIGQDASRARLRALQVMLKTLLESPFIQERINPNYVKKMAFHGSPLTDKECIVVAVLADVLRPYVPKRRPLDSGGTAPPLAHPTLMAPLVFIANSVLRATGYSHFARLTCPEVSPSSLQALHMGPAELYEVFCTNEEGRFDVNDARGRSLTSIAQATMPPENKRAIFEAFFDLPKIAQICDRHGLDFADRLVFVDRHCVRILGKEKEYSQDHSGYRRRSKYEERRKQKKSTGQINWNEELDRIQWTKDRAESQRTEVSQQLHQLELTVRQLRDELAVKEKNKSGLSQSVHERRKNRDLVEEGRWYYALRTYNKSVRRLRSTAMEKEAELRRLRQEQYYWTKVLAVSQVASKSAGEDELPADTVLTPNRFAVEDSTERLDLTQLPSDQVVFAGTDYGIVTMSETVPQTLSEIQVHLNRFALLFDQVDTDAPSTESPAQAGSSVAATATKRSVTQQIELEKLRLPRSHRITAKQINDISHSEKSARKRNRRLRSHDNRSTREAIEQLSNRENVLKTANSLGAIDSARRFHRSVEDDLKAFEASNARQRDLRNQRLRTAKAWAKLGATERTHVREHVRQHDVKNDRALVGTVAYGDGWCDSCLVHHIPRNSGGRFGHILQCPKEEKKYFKVMLIGDAGTGVGSRIKGHARRGGGKMRKEHRQHCTVGITSEYRSSKTCIFCFQEVRLARARRVIRGEVKTVKVHGAVECVNPKCPSLKCGYSIRPRDVHSAVAIAIAGASNLLSPERATLTPFKRQLRPLGVNPTTKNTSQTLELLSSSSSSRRIPGEPLADRGVL
ncbi:hypothetical protein BGW38_004979 [Lunasporangiospora selenospora]|uniref:Uncharacterized protein n=1 Tax=Lunasporangiospora selenospora TaxID=979761 RepID=A0A9P6KBS5_9FUNG|nr:hypothetical protein BGW38_004979 [Lunasporangiospora selenospora]